ncbi:MAG: dipeptide epimerase [Polyangiales bacterium]
MKLRAFTERWPIADAFVIARGSKTSADVVVAEFTDGEFVGRGECVPYARFGQNVDACLEEIAGFAALMRNDQHDIFDELRGAELSSATKNAIDCAFWDFRCKRDGVQAWDLMGLAVIDSLPLSRTISLGSVNAMADAALGHPEIGLLKIKLDADDIVAKVAAVHRRRPDAQLIVDANESWSLDQLRSVHEELADLGVVLIEQPLRADDDRKLKGFASAVPLCADESMIRYDDIERIAALYDVINLKLDKCGGLTDALVWMKRADEIGLQTMVGCMVCTSLSIAPAFYLAQRADFVDLDGAWLLSGDREHGIRYKNGMMLPPDAVLWG